MWVQFIPRLPLYSRLVWLMSNKRQHSVRVGASSNVHHHQENMKCDCGFTSCDCMLRPDLKALPSKGSYRLIIKKMENVDMEITSLPW